MKRRTVAGIALAALTMGGVALAALTAGGVVLGALTAALIASSSPADAGGWGRHGYGRHGYGGHYRYGPRYYRPYGYGYGRHGYGHRGRHGFSLSLVLPLSSPYQTYDTYTPPAAAPAPQAAPATQPYCREYTGPVVINGEQVSSYGTACLQEDGSWKIVE